MFSDKSFDVVGFNSCWKTERELHDEEVQTADCSYQMQESQTNVLTNAETQTDNIQVEMMVPENVDYDKLAAFLRYVGPLVIKELDKCHKSRAFDSYELLDDDIDGMVKKLHDLQIPPNFGTYKGIFVSSLSWFCTGGVVACGYSFTMHEDWCDHNSWIQLFNINRPSAPSRTLEVSACVTCLSAHPFEPSILASGCYSGNVIVWNLKNDDNVSSSSTLSSIHRERVSQVSWIHNVDTSQKRPLLVTSSIDGRILIWKTGTHSGSSQLSEAFIITLERIRYLSLDMFVPSPVGIAATGMEIGINCFSFSTLDPTCFVVGVDGGILLCCSTIAAKPAPVDADVPLKDPILRAFDRHQGNVTCVKCSPHREDSFISCGTDREIRMYLMEQSSPVYVIFAEAGVIGMEWSLAYSKIVAAWGNDNNTVDFYNLHTKETVPSLQISTSEKSEAIVALNSNPQNHRLIAVGDLSGRVTIWQQCSYKGE